MNTILFTNASNKFGKKLISNLSEHNNIIFIGSANVFENTPCNVEYINYDKFKPNYNKNTLLDIIEKTTSIIKSANYKYGGVDVCVDCSNYKNAVNFPILLMHQSIINNSIKLEKNCKILYKNNKCFTDHINLSYSSIVKSFNCSNNYNMALDIINNAPNPGSKFDFNSYEGKYSPLLYV